MHCSQNQYVQTWGTVISNFEIYRSDIHRGTPAFNYVIRTLRIASCIRLMQQYFIPTFAAIHIDYLLSKVLFPFRAYSLTHASGIAICGFDII